MPSPPVETVGAVGAVGATAPGCDDAISGPAWPGGRLVMLAGVVGAPVLGLYGWEPPWSTC